MRLFVIGIVIIMALGTYLLWTQPADQAGPGQAQVRFAFPGSVKSVSLFSRLARRFMELNPDIHIKLEPNVGDFRQPKDVFLAGSDVDGSGAVSPSLDVFLQDFVSDYTAHVLGVSAVIRF